MKKGILTLLNVLFTTALIFLIHTQRTYAKNTSEKTKVYIMYSPSHAQMTNEWFKPSVLAHDHDCEIVETLLPQKCVSGRYYEQGWKEVMIKKLDLLIKATEENMGDAFIYADVDIQFFGPFSKCAVQCLGNKDVVFQQEAPVKNNQRGQSACAGFIVCRANQKTLSLWNQAKERMKCGYEHCDQTAIAQILCLSDQLGQANSIEHSTYGISNLNWDFLPWKKFFGPGMSTTKKQWKKFTWTPGGQLGFPRSILMHHANLTIGSDHKIQQLFLVKTAFAQGLKKGTAETTLYIYDQQK